MIVVLFFISGIYFLLMGSLLLGFRKQPKFQQKAIPHKTRFSILIPFRNEAQNLPQLLESISKLKYPKSLFEVVLINDESEDDSEAIVRKFIAGESISVQLLQNKRVSNSPKKDALTIGVAHANSEWIVTTDADCNLSSDWLTTLDEFIQKEKPVMVCGPIIYNSNDSLIEKFQLLDGLSLQTVTIGSFGLNFPLLSNGANSAFLKSSFYQVDGFEGNNHLASGDDIFLMEKIRRAFPGRLRFLKSRKALVATQPQKSWKSLIEQRIRWASKTSQQKNGFSWILGLNVFLTNLSLLAIPMLLYFDLKNLWFYILIVLLKMFFDYQFINQSARFFNTKTHLGGFVISFFIYPFVLIAVLIGSLSGKFAWKGRVYQNQQ